MLEAIRLLVKNRIGSLMVENDEGKIVRIITERDTLNESAERSKFLDQTPVREIMTRDLHTGVPDDDVNHLLMIMTEKRVRHLPIMKGEDLVGLVSIGDLVKARLSETQDENIQLRDYIQGR